ncbi:42734_t:CDS:2 [Gigaspora margarita]|uniref:DNA topoisomerase n=1 Tax=Gigaspora margarita TaxID=4874 RepID=A0ABN7UGQ7_GIGMA|nr:42734_t:CDS:2 [Gigaspora margarita]
MDVKKTESLKLRIQPEQVTINIGKNAEIPRPPDGKESDRTVTWLTRWKDNVNDIITRQTVTVMYLIDHLTLRADNQKDVSKEADTIGFCSLRVEHVSLTPSNKVKFDFLGKDSVEYVKEAKVESQVFENLEQFKHGKKIRPYY